MINEKSSKSFVRASFLYEFYYEIIFVPPEDKKPKTKCLSRREKN